jgi:hypothetical protein
MTTNDTNDFESLVVKSWGDAVGIASSHIERYRSQLFESLQSLNPEVRSAAIAALNEGNVTSAHDIVLSLIDDTDEWVRHEVAEYLLQFAVSSDAEILLARIERYPDLRFVLSKVLCRLTGRDDGIIDDEDPPEKVERELGEWRDFLIKGGYIKG